MLESTVKSCFEEVIQEAERRLEVTFSDSDPKDKIRLFKFIRICIFKARVVLTHEHCNDLGILLIAVAASEEGAISLELMDKLIQEFKKLREVVDVLLEEVKQEEKRLLEIQSNFNETPLREDVHLIKLVIEELGKGDPMKKEAAKQKEIIANIFLEVIQSCLTYFERGTLSEEYKRLFEEKFKEASKEEDDILDLLLQTMQEIKGLETCH